MRLIKYKNSGFTLAEVLITLAIIGVVAALTIPALIKNTNDRETVVKLKKVYSTLSSATNSIVAERGPIATWDWDTGDATMDNVVADYKKYIKFDKSCAYNTGGCYYEVNWKMLNGSVYFTSFTAGGAYYNIMSDGTYVKFLKGAWAWQVSSNLKPQMTIIVNLNGDKPPNQIGRDVFFFYLTETHGIIPPDVNVDTFCKTSSNGESCSTKVLNEDAINY